MIHVLFRKFLRSLTASRQRRTLVVGLLALALVLLGSTVAFRYLESDQDLSYFDALWLSYVTMTTVGYGDLYPKTDLGRLFGMVLTMTGGIGIVAYVITMLATTFIEWEHKRVHGLAQVDESDHILIINCPMVEKVLTVINEIRLDKETGDAPIVLVDNNLESCPESLMQVGKFSFVRGNPLLRRTLMQANAPAATKAIILAADSRDPTTDGVTTQTALTLEAMHREAGTEIHTVAEAVSKDSVEPLRAAGVEDVICLETVMAPLLVQALLDPGVADLASQLTSNTEGYQYYVGDVSAAAGSTYAQVRRHFENNKNLKVIPLGMVSGDAIIVNPEDDPVIRKGDRLCYIAQERQDLESLLSDLKRG